MSQARYQFQIYNRGVVSTTGTVAYTWATSQLRVPPTIGTGIPRPLAGSVESASWTVGILDRNSTFTATLGDSSGRLHHIGRLARLRRSLDSTASTAYQTQFVGRIADLAMSGDVAGFEVTVDDERWVERQTPIFVNANTAMTLPPGLINKFQAIPRTPPQNWRCVQKNGNLVALNYEGSVVMTLGMCLDQLMAQDVKASAVIATTITVGNFQTLRFRHTGTSTDYELAAVHLLNFEPEFGLPLPPVPWAIAPNAPRPMTIAGSADLGLILWLVWTASQPNVGDVIPGYCYMPTHAPTPVLPLHVGGENGLHPMTLGRQVYQGSFSASTAVLPRISTAAFQALANDPGYQRVWFRITESQ